MRGDCSISRGEVTSLLPDVLQWAGPLATDSPSDEAVIHVLRSVELRDAAASVFPADSGSDIEEARARIHDFVRHRASLLKFRGPMPQFASSDVEREFARPQALLLFAPGWSLFDGAATPASHGFINDEYFPPWDTWLTMVPCNHERNGRSYGLLTWVPNWAAALVDLAIEVDPGNCESWVRADDGPAVSLQWGQP